MLGSECRARLRKHLKKPYIPSTCVNFFDTLTVKGDANEFGMQETTAMPQEVKCPVVIAAAHANAIADQVECNQRCDAQIQLRGCYRPLGGGLEQSEITPHQVGGRPNFGKDKWAGFFCDRRKNALFHAPCALDQRPGIDLFGGWQVTGYPTCAPEQ